MRARASGMRGRLLRDYLRTTCTGGHYDNVALDVFILMPNHVHGVITIED